MMNDSKRAVGRIDYLYSRGNVGEQYYLYDEESFFKRIREDNYYGTPMVINLFRDEHGKTMPLDFIEEFDPPVCGFRILDYKEDENLNENERDRVINRKEKQTELLEEAEQQNEVTIKCR